MKTPSLRLPLATLVVALISVGLSAQSSQELKVATRYGELTIGENMTLLFRGRPLRPTIHGNSGIDLGAPFHIRDTDVVLVSITGGTACPYLYYFVTARKDGAVGTPSFGTCNSSLGIKRTGDSISMSMHGYRGPFEPEAERKKALHETHVFVYQDGVISKDKGK
jgi:hypothetical protein